MEKVIMHKVYIAADHAGFALKELLIPYIGALGCEIEDLGAYEFEEGDDYPDYAMPCARAVVEHGDAVGIVIGGSGQGEAMVANRVEGIRAAVFYGYPENAQTDADGTRLDIVTSSRAHNDANVLSLGGRFLREQEAKEAVRIFLTTPFSGESRHERRIHEF